MTRDAVSTAPADGRAPLQAVGAVVRDAFKPLLWRLSAMSLFVNLLTLAAPLFVLQVYDRVIPHAGLETLKALAIGVVALILFDFVLRRARGRAVQAAALRVDVALSRAAFDRLTGLPLRAIERRSGADWRTTLRDVETVRDAVAGPTVLLAVDLPFALVFLAGVWLAAPPVALLLTLLIPVFVAVAAASAATVGGASRDEQKAALDRHALAEELVSGRATIKTLGLGAALRGRWEQAQATAIRRSVERGALVDAFSQAGASLTTLATVLMTTVGAAAIVHQDMTIGGLIAANMLAVRILQPLTQLIGLWRGWSRAREAAARIDALLAAPLSRPAAAVERPRPKGDLAAEGLSFAYAPDAPPVIDGVTARFPAGTAIGLIGENGAGKSTLLKLLMGRYGPDRGRVTLDGADLAQFGDRELSRWFGYLPQEPFLFAGSVRDNIVGGREGVADAEILSAARLAGAEAFISALPDGFGAPVGEGGGRLPPGHRQRIALARALAADPAVLVLDEPSANLDRQAELALAERLAALKSGRSLVLVSHSETLLGACDLVMALSGGRIAMAGPAAEMIARRDATPATSRARPQRPPLSAEGGR